MSYDLTKTDFQPPVFEVQMSQSLRQMRVQTYAVDLFDDVFEDEGGGETVVLADCLSSDVLEDHLHCRVVQLEGFD